MNTCENSSVESGSTIVPNPSTTAAAPKPGSKRSATRHTSSNNSNPGSTLPHRPMK